MNYRYNERFGFSKEVLTEDVTKTVNAKINAEIIPRHLGTHARPYPRTRARAIIAGVAAYTCSEL